MDQENAESALAQRLLDSTTRDQISNIFNVLSTLDKLEYKFDRAYSISQLGSQDQPVNRPLDEDPTMRNFYDKYFCQISELSSILPDGSRVAYPYGSEGTVPPDWISFIENKSKIQDTGMVMVNNVKIPGVVE